MDVKDFDVPGMNAVEDAIGITQQRYDAHFRTLLNAAGALGPGANER